MGRTDRLRALRAAALLAVVVAVSGCGGSTTATSPTRTTSPPGATVGTGAGGSTSSTTPVPTAPSSGCGTTVTPGTVTLRPTVGGRRRTVVVHLPGGAHGSTPLPLVLNLHGSQSTAVDQEAFSGMDATADADTFIVAYPQGDIPSGSGFEWNVPGQPLFGGAAVPTDAPDDVTFLERLVTSLGQRYCVDEHRVYATGFSGGARMASQLGCDASTVVAAVAPVSGLRLPLPCPSARPVPVVSFHGTADPVDPYGGNGQRYWTYSVPVAAGRWAAHDGCAATPERSVPDPGVVLTAYAGCPAGSAVELYSITGEGHEWPGGPPLPRSITRVLGPRSDALSANSVMWAFFVAHPMP